MTFPSTLDAARRQASWQPPSDDDRDKLIAVALVDRVKPQVFEFDDTPEAREELSLLIGSGNVLALFYGKRLRFAVESVVTIGGDQASKHASIVKNSELL